MDFGLTEEQQAIQDTARKFAREKIAPDFQKREETGVIERGLVKEMGALGLVASRQLFGIPIYSKPPRL